MSGWCLIESDPGVFTELIETIGVKDTEVCEVHDLSELPSSCHGLIFLFQWLPNTQKSSFISYETNIFFANQTIQNACATQALLSILLNSPNLEIGETLKDFKEFTTHFPSDLKGEAIGNSHILRDAHNSFARADPFVNEQVAKDDQEAEDVYHFVSFVPCNGYIYELDGLQAGPIRLDVVGDNWLEKGLFD